MTRRALLLNVDYSPLAVIPDHRAVVKYLTDKAEVVEYSEHVFRSPSITVMVPSILRERRYVDLPAKQRSVLLTTPNVLQRDEFVCAYCGVTLTVRTGTMDHVLPRAKGGRHVWENVTAACVRCNQMKRDWTLAEMRERTGDDARWTLTRPCSRPPRLFTESPEPEWMPYLQVA